MLPQHRVIFLPRWKGANLVLIDSGGLQEETTTLGVPCITVCESSERPVMVDEGTNKHLAGTDPARIVALDILGKGGKAGRQPHLWDGQADRHIVDGVNEAQAIKDKA